MYYFYNYTGLLFLIRFKRLDRRCRNLGRVRTGIGQIILPQLRASEGVQRKAPGDQGPSFSQWHLACSGRVFRALNTLGQEHEDPHSLPEEVCTHEAILTEYRPQMVHTYYRLPRTDVFYCLKPCSKILSLRKARICWHLKSPAIWGKLPESKMISSPGEMKDWLHFPSSRQSLCKLVRRIFV